MMPLFAQQLGRPSGLWGPVLASVWNRRNVALNDAAFEGLALRPNDRVLEVGFGGGYLLGRMAAVVTGGFLAGVDVSPAMVAFCERRFRAEAAAGTLHLRCAAVDALPFPARHFTKACSVNSIFYWPDTRRALSQLFRVLAWDGLLVLCFTCRASLERRGFARHVGLYEPHEVAQTLAACGFGDIRITCCADRHRQFVCMAARRPPKED